MGSKLSEGKRKALQNRSLEILAQNPSISYKALSEAIGIGKDCVGRWYRDNVDGYQQRYDQVLKEAFNKLEGLAIQCMADLIVDGNFQAAKYVLDNRGYKAEDKIKADITGDIDINISIEE